VCAAGPSGAGPSGVAAAPPPSRMSEQAQQAVAEYQAALSPERPAQDEAAPTAAGSESPGKRRYGTAPFAAFTYMGLNVIGQTLGPASPPMIYRICLQRPLFYHLCTFLILTSL